MATLRGPDDYQACLVEVLRRLGGRASRGQVLREFERRFYASIPLEQRTAPPDRGGAPPWQRAVDDAERALARRGQLFAPDHDLWELA